jgi:hypothetical protein
LRCTYPYRRFAAPLAENSARLGADADRYSFIAMDFHHLIPAGLPALRQLELPAEEVADAGQALDLFRRQAQLETDLGQLGGIHVTEERDAILQTARNLNRSVDTLRAQDGQRLRLITDYAPLQQASEVWRLNFVAQRRVRNGCRQGGGIYVR